MCHGVCIHRLSSGKITQKFWKVFLNRNFVRIPNLCSDWIVDYENMEKFCIQYHTQCHTLAGSRILIFTPLTVEELSAGGCGTFVGSSRKNSLSFGYVWEDITTGWIVEISCGAVVLDMSIGVTQKAFLPAKNRYFLILSLNPYRQNWKRRKVWIRTFICMNFMWLCLRTCVHHVRRRHHCHFRALAA